MSPYLITDQQLRVLIYINTHQDVHGRVPSIAQIQGMLGHRQHGATIAKLRALEGRGLIERAPLSVTPRGHDLIQSLKST